MVECTALEMRHGCKPIGGSNPSLSAIFRGDFLPNSGKRLIRLRKTLPAVPHGGVQVKVSRNARQRWRPLLFVDSTIASAAYEPQRPHPARASSTCTISESVGRDAFAAGALSSPTRLSALPLLSNCPRRQTNLQAVCFLELSGDLALGQARLILSLRWRRDLSSGLAYAKLCHRLNQENYAKSQMAIHRP